MEWDNEEAEELHKIVLSYLKENNFNETFEVPSTRGGWLGLGCLNRRI